MADPNTVRRIARLAEVGPGDRVVEIGAGLGSLTLALVETGAMVTAVEIDRRLLPVLRSVVAPAGVSVVEGDAMTLDWAALLGAGAVRQPHAADTPWGTGGHSRSDGAAAAVREPHADDDAGALSAPWGNGGHSRSDGAAAAVREPHADDDAGALSAPWHLVANLPYNIATPLVADLLDGVPQIATMLVMVQREVGERLAAKVGDAGYGAVSVKVAYWAEAAVVGRVPPSVFIPAPKVESALVRIVRRPAPAVAVDPDRLFTVVRAGFAHRRKMLRGTLAGVVDPAAFERAGVAPTARAEELDVAAWGRLAALT